MGFPSPNLEGEMRSVVPAVLGAGREQAEWACQDEAEVHI